MDTNIRIPRMIKKRPPNSSRQRKSKKALEDLIVQFLKEKEELISVENVFNEWNNRRVKLNQISCATYDRNIRVFNRHFSRLKEMDIKKITSQILNDFFEEEIAEKNLSAKAFAGLKRIPEEGSKVWIDTVQC